LCSFIVPAVVKRGALEVAISTSGASPALARMLREEIGESLGPEYETLVRILGAARPRLRELSADAATRSAIARELARGLRDALVRRDGEAAEQIVRRLLGVSLSALSGAPETRPAGSIIK
jgi:precorrin-2 dehydrogenase/sirohydrochlorin ferrochelatase